MKVRARLLGFPGASRYHEAVLETGTVGELTDWVERTLATPSGISLKNASGRLDDSLSILKNQGTWVDPSDPSALLTEGDDVTYFVVLAGG